LVREDSPDPLATVKKLAALVELDEKELLSRLNKVQRKRRAFEPRLLVPDISRDMLAVILAHKYELPGVQIHVAPARYYPHGEFAAHALGYIREIGESQLQSGAYPGYRQGDLIGQSGVEQMQEFMLFGKRGVQHVIVNAVGVRIENLYYEADRAGHRVTLTLDYGAQEAADKGLAGQRGSLVALDPRNGEIIAMASHPGFDPNIFSGALTADTWNNLVNGKERPLNNRAFQGAYPPGSVFKIIMSVAGLAEGVIGKNEVISCPGYFRVGKSRPFHCHKRSGHGGMTLKNALQKSCNVYYFNVGQRLGIDRIHDYATRFGFGTTTGIGIGTEVTGLVPSTKWKREYFSDPENQRWYPGETPSVAIGQGALTVTPLQVARAIGALANGGTLYKPQIIKRVSAQESGFHDEVYEPEVVGTLGVEQWVLDEVKAGLWSVVNEQGGTAYARGRVDERLGIESAGKTGTAQTRGLQHGDDTDIAWFVAFAPYDDPQLVVVAAVEDGGHGGVTAAPIVKAVMDAYFSKKLGISLEDEGKGSAA
jgi:penicillin-binding protein 2